PVCVWHRSAGGREGADAAGEREHPRAGGERGEGRREGEAGAAAVRHAGADGTGGEGGGWGVDSELHLRRNERRPVLKAGRRSCCWRCPLHLVVLSCANAMC